MDLQYLKYSNLANLHSTVQQVQQDTSHSTCKTPTPKHKCQVKTESIHHLAIFQSVSRRRSSCSLRLQGSNLTGFHHCSIYTFVKNGIATKLLLQLRCVFYFYSCVFFSIYKIVYVVEFLFLQILLSSWKHFHAGASLVYSHLSPISTPFCCSVVWQQVVLTLSTSWCIHSLIWDWQVDTACMHVRMYALE